MHSTFKILLYINNNKVKADGTTAVLCRISIDGKIRQSPQVSIASRKAGTAAKGKSRRIEPISN